MGLANPRLTAVLQTRCQRAMERRSVYAPAARSSKGVGFGQPRMTRPEAPHRSSLGAILRCTAQLMSAFTIESRETVRGPYRVHRKQGERHPEDGLDVGQQPRYKQVIYPIESAERQGLWTGRKTTDFRNRSMTQWRGRSISQYGHFYFG